MAGINRVLSGLSGLSGNLSGRPPTGQTTGHSYKCPLLSGVQFCRGEEEEARTRPRISKPQNQGLTLCLSISTPSRLIGPAHQIAYLGVSARKPLQTAGFWSRCCSMSVPSPMRQFKLLLPAALDAGVATLAARRCRTKSDVIRQALLRELEDHGIAMKGITVPKPKPETSAITDASTKSTEQVLAEADAFLAKCRAWAGG